ncbi:MAG: hypothetical protein KatS3mg111_1385 [Pirellulaceae bacterium]|nr:MAG: hypothetical protein KatS3mg111_1385 [Pirellulaceae bacterium]
MFKSHEGEENSGRLMPGGRQHSAAGSAGATSSCHLIPMARRVAVHGSDLRWSPRGRATLDLTLTPYFGDGKAGSSDLAMAGTVRQMGRAGDLS